MDSNNTPYLVATSRDTQKIKGASGDYTPVNEVSVKALNRELREPTELVLFPGGVYECTINDEQRGFSQSQMAFLLDLPAEDAVENHTAIKIWVAPAATDHVAFDVDDLPSRERLVALGWSETTLGCAAERDINVRGGLVARRVQYSLKHIGATTINKSMGATLPYGIAAEILEKYAPWESGQIVVVLSRSESPSRTIIVGDQAFAINKMWELITTGNQWTRYTKHILDVISINGNEAGPNQCVFDYPQVYPFRQIDGDLPSDTTGYSYCLVSKPNPHRIYIGQTQCLTQRFLQHQSGTGSQGTHDPRDRPWAMGAYICGLSHMKTMERMSLERSWKEEVQSMQMRGQDESYSWIMAGRRVVQMYNSGTVNEDEHIRFVPMVTAGAVSRG